LLVNKFKIKINAIFLPEQSKRKKDEKKQQSTFWNQKMKQSTSR